MKQASPQNNTSQPFCPAVLLPKNIYPTSQPSGQPSRQPSVRPTTQFPTESPTEAPSEIPTYSLSESPTALPSETLTHTGQPTDTPTTKPTETPTATPTATPTEAPTETQVVGIDFDVTVVIIVNGGCDSFDLASQASFVQSIAEVMGVDTAYVIFITCIPRLDELNNNNIVYTERAQTQNKQRDTKTLETETPLQVVTKIKAPASQISVYDPTFAEENTKEAAAVQVFEVLKNRLETSVYSGNFTKTLQKISTQEGAVAIVNASVTSATVGELTLVFPPTIAPTMTPSVDGTPTISSSNDNTSLILIVSLVIVTVLLLILVGLLIGCYCAPVCRNKEENMDDTQLYDKFTAPIQVATAPPAEGIPFGHTSVDMDDNRISLRVEENVCDPFDGSPQAIAKATLISSESNGGNSYEHDSQTTFDEEHVSLSFIYMTSERFDGNPSSLSEKM
jgi:hypothetical protein